MGLNKSSGNMYDWVTHTWNPLGGECPHKCKYCSTNKLGERYPVIKKKYTGHVELIEHELKTNLGKNNTIFVCAQHDLFADSIPMMAVCRIIKYLKLFDNTYLFQTKNPSNLYNNYVDILPKKSIICTTIESNNHKISEAPMQVYRALGMSLIKLPKYVTIEPIINFDMAHMIEYIKMCDPIQVNIGANSDPKIKLPEPSKEKILELITELEKFTKVKLKKNLNRLI